MTMEYTRYKRGRDVLFTKEAKQKGEIESQSCIGNKDVEEEKEKDEYKIL